MQIAKSETKIIPGHLGPVIGFKEIQQQLDMFVTGAHPEGDSRGDTLEQVASKPTADF